MCLASFVLLRLVRFICDWPKEHAHIIEDRPDNRERCFACDKSCPTLPGESPNNVAALQLDGKRVSITGHSMGGHGALTLYLAHPGMYKSVSAFAPITNPSKCPWGQKAFKGYLGEDEKLWAKHDATELIASYPESTDILIDVGTGDNFYKDGQLLPENFEAAAKKAVAALTAN